MLPSDHPKERFPRQARSRTPNHHKSFKDRFKDNFRSSYNSSWRQPPQGGRLQALHRNKFRHVPWQECRLRLGEIKPHLTTFFFHFQYFKGASSSYGSGRGSSGELKRVPKWPNGMIATRLLWLLGHWNLRFCLSASHSFSPFASFLLTCSLASGCGGCKGEGGLGTDDSVADHGPESNPGAGNR